MFTIKILTVQFKYAILLLIKKEVQTMNEIIPNGYLNWTEYNRAKARQEKHKMVIQGVIGMVAFFGLIFLDGFINTAF
jgi:hypothetical protein